MYNVRLYRLSFVIQRVAHIIILNIHIYLYTFISGICFRETMHVRFRVHYILSSSIWHSFADDLLFMRRGFCNSFSETVGFCVMTIVCSEYVRTCVHKNIERCFFFITGDRKNKYPVKLEGE